MNSETPAEISAENSGWTRRGFALALNFFAVLLYAFGLIGPLLPSDWPPSMFVVLIFVGTPSALIFVASRLCRSHAPRMVCYTEIAFLICLYAYIYWDLAQMVGRGRPIDA